MRLKVISRRCITPITVIALVGLSLVGTANVGAASAASSKSAINVMLSTQLTGGSLYPEIKGATLAAVKQVNASGGINGHPINLSICDDQSNPNVAATCAQQAVANNDVAVLGIANVEDVTMLPILQHAGIAFIGQDESTPLDATTPISFQTATGAYDLNNGGGSFGKAAG